MGYEGRYSMVYQFKITLEGIDPPVWRCVLIPARVTLLRLSTTILLAMGWQCSHLHRFRLAGKDWGVPADDMEDVVDDLRDDRAVKLARFDEEDLRAFVFEYDFGDQWKHLIELEEIGPRKKGVQYPVCIGGARNCPPEDVGGTEGYKKFLAAIREPGHEEHGSYLEWVGGAFDPERFDMKALNKQLRKVSAIENQCWGPEDQSAFMDETPQPEPEPHEFFGPAKVPDLRALERISSDIHRAVTRQDFKSEDEMKVFLEKTVRQGQVPKEPPKSALQYAQDIMYEVWECGDPEERLRMAREALSVCADCADAYNLLAEEAALSEKEAGDYYRKGVEAGERALGPEIFKEYAGHFWGYVPTRPYMRARVGLFEVLRVLGKYDEALFHAREMLQLNHNDNQGIRYLLSALLADLGRYDELEVFMNQKEFKNDGGVEWLYMGALLAFVRNGDCARSCRALKSAIRSNPHVPDYLCGKKSIPPILPAQCAVGEEDEGYCVAWRHAGAWKKVAGSIGWLQDVAGIKYYGKVRRNEPCPCGSGKKYKKCCGNE